MKCPDDQPCDWPDGATVFEHHIRTPHLPYRRCKRIEKVLGLGLAVLVELLGIPYTQTECARADAEIEVWQAEYEIRRERERRKYGD